MGQHAWDRVLGWAAPSPFCMLKWRMRPCPHPNHPYPPTHTRARTQPPRPTHLYPPSPTSIVALSRLATSTSVPCRRRMAP